MAADHAKLPKCGAASEKLQQLAVHCTRVHSHGHMCTVRGSSLLSAMWLLHMRLHPHTNTPHLVEVADASLLHTPADLSTIEVVTVRCLQLYQ